MKHTHPEPHLTLASVQMGNVGTRFFSFCLLLCIIVLSVNITKLQVRIGAKYGSKEIFLKDEYETTCCCPDAKKQTKTKQTNQAISLQLFKNREELAYIH